MHQSSRRPLVAAVHPAPRVHLRSPWRGFARPTAPAALLLAGLDAIAITILLGHLLASPASGTLAAAAGCGVLFAVAESLVVRLDLRETRVELVLRATPLLVGLAFSSPAELAAAGVLGMSVALVLVRRVPVRVAGPQVAAGLLGTTLAAIAFNAFLDLGSVHVLEWWLAACGAASTLAVACALAATLLADGGRPTAGRLGAVAAYATVAAVVDASLAMTVVIFLRTEPSELWLLAGPVAVGIAGLRAVAGLRRRQARIELLYACAQLLDGAADGGAMLAELLERVRLAVRAEAAEILVDGVADVPLRVATGAGVGLDRLSGVAAEAVHARRALLPPGAEATILRAGPTVAGHPLVDGVLARFDGRGGVSGVVSVAGPADGSRFGTDDRTLLEALARLLGDALAGERMVEELRATRADLERLAALVAGSDDAIIGVSVDGTVVSWNPAAEALFGQPAAAVIGRKASLLAGDAGRPAITAAFARACNGEQTREVAFDARHPDGTVVPVSATVSPVRADGAIAGVSVIARDETMRALADTVLRESLDRFERVFQGSPAGMGVVGGDFRWLRANDALARALGAAPDELVGRRFELAVARDDIEPAHGLVSRTLRGEVEAGAVEVRLRAPAGGDAGHAADLVALLSVRSLHAPGDHRHVLLTLDDITERRRAEGRAREAKARAQAAVLALTRIREPEEVLRTAVHAARDATAAEAALIVLPDERAWGHLHIVGEDGGTGLLAAIVEHERLLVLAGGRRTTRLPQSGHPASWPFAATGLRSFLAVPVDLEDGTSGVLVLANRAGEAGFDDDDVGLAEALATQAGLSLGNARAHERALTLVRELDRSNARLTEASAAKARFLANVSHELRSPLHSIMLGAGLLVSPQAARDPERLRALPAAIEGSSRYLLRLIDDLIDLSRMEVSELRVEPVEVELRPVLTAVRNQLAALAEDRGLRLEFPAACRTTLVADPLRLRQVLVNLGSNAIKYTPEGGTVRFTVASTRAHHRIDVSDTGIGIAPGDLERIFEPFTRLAYDRAPGAGLGLPIARRIVELHGGTLTASARPGEGSTFSVVLPRGVTAQAGTRPLVSVADDDPAARTLAATRLGGGA
jgi:PAS domain S-box-containing protein